MIRVFSIAGSCLGRLAAQQGERPARIDPAIIEGAAADDAGDAARLLRLEPREIVDWLLEDQLAVRFQLQMHKFIWPPEMKGV